MTDEPRDAEERKARAAKLREQIGRITKGSAKGDAKQGSKDQPNQPESPRDFIHRRMRELDAEDK